VAKIPIYFIGFGDFALELLADWEGFNLSRTHQFAGYFDDNLAKAKDEKYKGTVAEAWSLPAETSVVLTAASPVFRKHWVLAAPSSLIYPNMIHLRSKLGANIALGKGNIISEGCIFTTDIFLGDFNVFNHYVTIGHHCQIGSGNALMTKAHISGRCDIGDYNFIGVGASILQGKSMGNHNLLGAHSCLMHFVQSYETLVGIPALSQKKN
jgi:carbonic anhydrase/acetyltransferase-like protein (isoleucine patch superfamily)